MWQGRLNMTQVHKIFAKLCEAYVTEVSSALDLVRGQPGGAEVIQKLHTSQQLAHDLVYKPVDKISWSSLKDAYRGAWVVITGNKGVAAIKASGGNTGTYTALAYNPVTKQVEQFSDGRGGNVIAFIKDHIGSLSKYYVASNTTSVRDKQRDRSARKEVPGGIGQPMSQDTLIKKFKPLWVKAMTAAIADIKGMASTMIKNDAFDKAAKKIALLKSIEDGIDMVQAGNEEVPSSVKRAVQVGILMAAAHHYPDQTGEITSSRYGGGYSSERPEGVQQLLTDIGKGDTAKLGTILSFFKRSLISG